jgi:hypothetical protein
MNELVNELVPVFREAGGFFFVASVIGIIAFRREIYVAIREGLFSITVSIFEIFRRLSRKKKEGNYEATFD